MNDVTVLLPVYNGQDYIRTSLESLFTQSYDAFEILVMDDGSSDETPGIVQQLNDNRIRYVRSPVNRGLIATLNAGIDLVCTPYIARMDHDDIAYSERLLVQKEFLDSNPAVGVVGSSVSILDTGETIKYPQTDSTIKITMLDHSPFAHPAVMYRTEVVKACKYDHQYTHAEDYALWVALSEKTQFANIDQPLLRYRRHSGQITSKHFAEQKKMRSAIIRNYLKHLIGEDLSEDDIKCHLAFLGISRWGDTRALRSWVDKLRKAGRGSHYWKAEDFERFVNDILFYRLDQQFINKISRYLKRSLGIGNVQRVNK